MCNKGVPFDPYIVSGYNTSLEMRSLKLSNADSDYYYLRERLAHRGMERGGDCPTGVHARVREGGGE